jgi:hypothetical protein
MMVFFQFEWTKSFTDPYEICINGELLIMLHDLLNKKMSRIYI